MPGWRNGIREGLKILCSKGHVGSTPTPGTTIKLSGILPIDSAARSAPSVSFKKGLDLAKQSH
jgi:hypothetical protein